MKRKTAFIVALLGILLFGTAIFLVKYLSTPDNSNEMTPHDKCIYILNQVHPTDIALFGEEILFDEKLRYRKLSSLDKEELKTNMEHQIIVISDLNGTVRCTEDELKYLKALVEDGHCSVFYIGTAMKKQLFSTGLFKLEEYWDSTILGAARDGEDMIYGIWTTSDPVPAPPNYTKTLGFSLELDFADIIRNRYQ